MKRILVIVVIFALLALSATSCRSGPYGHTDSGQIANFIVMPFILAVGALGVGAYTVAAIPVALYRWASDKKIIWVFDRRPWD